MKNVQKEAKRTKVRQTRRLMTESLENRQLMAVDTIVYADGLLTLRANNSPTHVELSMVGSNVRLTEGAAFRDISAPGLTEIHFHGGNADDFFKTNIPAIRLVAHGGSGNDTIYGSNTNDHLYGDVGHNQLFGLDGDDELEGGDGDDKIEGGTGNDRLFGQAGNDVLKGFAGDDALYGHDGDDTLIGGTGTDWLRAGNGNDYLDGQDGNDTLFGELGNDVLKGGYGVDRLYGGDGHDHLDGQYDPDFLYGEAGDDVLVSIDSAFSDDLFGGTGADTFWMDYNSSTLHDDVYGQESIDRAHRVGSFANGADRTINGDRIADPRVTIGGINYRRFENIPLFTANGPSSDDALQGSLGDCYLLAGMSAVAQDSPQAIRHSIVDFRDGTYGVNLYGKFYRVDNDLPVFGVLSKNLQLAEAGDRPAYAQLGRESENAPQSMWVAIMEKAFAYARTGANSYDSLVGGWGVEVNRALGSTTSGERNISSYGSGAALANDLLSRYITRQAVTIGFLGSNPTGAPLVMQHMYSVAGFEFGSNGAITGVVLRNPWGKDGVSNSSPLGDGLVVVSPMDLIRLSGAVNWGKVA